MELREYLDEKILPFIIIEQQEGSPNKAFEEQLNEGYSDLYLSTSNYASRGDLIENAQYKDETADRIGIVENTFSAHKMRDLEIILSDEGEEEEEEMDFSQH